MHQGTITSTYVSLLCSFLNLPRCSTWAASLASTSLTTSVCIQTQLLWRSMPSSTSHSSWPVSFVPQSLWLQSGCSAVPISWVGWKVIGPFPPLPFPVDAVASKWTTLVCGWSWCSCSTKWSTLQPLSSTVQGWEMKVEQLTRCVYVCVCVRMRAILDRWEVYWMIAVCNCWS